MSTELGQRFADAWSSRNPDRFAALFTEDCVYDDVPLGVTAQGQSQIREHLRSWLSSSSDIKMEVHRQVSQEGHVAVEWTYSGTHDGHFHGIPPTGTQFRFRGASLFEADGQRIRACVDYWDLAHLLEVLRADSEEIAGTSRVPGAE